MALVIAGSHERPAMIADIGQQHGDGEGEPVGGHDRQTHLLDQDKGDRDMSRAGRRADRAEAEDLPEQAALCHQPRLATMTRETPNGSVTRPSRCRSIANTAPSRRLSPAEGISSSALPESPSRRPSSRLAATSGNRSVLK